MYNPLPVQTAKLEDSIWRPLSEDSFRRDIVALFQKCKGVPHGPTLWLPPSITGHNLNPSGIDRLLSFDTETHLADDIAYILAAKEGVGSVTAVCIEETPEPPALIIRVAANSGVDHEVRVALDHICGLLRSCAKNGGHDRRPHVAALLTVSQRWR